jgi:hypothetical protein
MNLVIKIGLLFCFLLGSFVSFSQDKIKFGYHDASGKVRVINTEKIENQMEEEKLVIPENSTFTSDSIIYPNDSVSTFISDSVFSELRDTINVSVLLPFYISKNETLIKFLLKNKRDINQIYNKSKLALNFLEGIFHAIDSLEKMGVPIVMNVYDTENNIDSVRKIVNTDFVKSSNIVFGPIYSDNFNFVKNFFRMDTNKILINPLSTNIRFLHNSQNVYFLTPVFQQHKETIISHLKLLDSASNITVISYDNNNEKVDYSSIKNNLKNSFKVIDFKSFKDLSQIRKQSFKFLGPNKNIVLVLSEDKAFIKKIVTFCGVSNTEISLYGTEKLKSIIELNIETLMKLKVHIPISNYSNKSVVQNQKLINRFEEQYHHQMNDYSVLSFKSILHFCSDKKQFKFIKFIEGGGFVNSNVKMCVYKDYQLNPVH